MAIRPLELKFYQLYLNWISIRKSDKNTLLFFTSISVYIFVKIKKSQVTTSTLQWHQKDFTTHTLNVKRHLGHLTFTVNLYNARRLSEVSRNRLDWMTSLGLRDKVRAWALSMELCEILSRWHVFLQSCLHNKQR